jgi:UDP-GlcNAc:undecaprenyl-phosphate/decaprenyl-phosphate GlcNAc-1-phosphate transferase
VLTYAFLFFGAVALSLVLTPAIRRLAISARVMDRPSERKVHATPIPLLGGVGIFLSFNITFIAARLLFHLPGLQPSGDRWLAFFVCQVIILALGVYDDVKRIQPRIKFAFQVFVGLLMFLAGFSIDTISSPFSGNLVHLGLLSLPLTVVWVAGITNGLNLVDGLDGLAAGTALFVAAAIFAISFIQQNMTVGFLALALAGSVLGFLRYNFFPASIFLGDSGSLLLGFILAVLSVQGSSKGATLVAVLAPVIALGLPIMDTFLSMLRRFLKSLRLIETRKEGKGRLFASMFEADKDHVHHRLLKMGFSHRRSVLILYVLCAVLCALAFLSVALANLNVVAFLVAILIVIFVGVRRLNYQEFKILQSGLLYPLVQFPAVGKKLFSASFDLCAIAVSYSTSYLLSVNAFGAPSKQAFLSTVAFMTLFKMGAFYLAGTYKGAWIRTSFGDLMALARTVFITSLAGATGLSLLFGRKASGGAIFFLLDFYILFSLVLGFRIFYRVVNDLYRQSLQRREKKLLVYGAGQRGRTVLQEIQNSGSYLFAPIGFIDDDAGKSGQILDGCPVLGTLDDLDAIVSRNPIREIIVSTEKIGRDKIGRLLGFCKDKGITVRQFEFRFYEFE